MRARIRAARPALGLALLALPLLAAPAMASEGLAQSLSGLLTGPAGFLALGFVVGLAHALEADHVTAVAAMIGRGEGRGAVVARGALWGLGHTLALFVICSAVVALGLTISPRVESGLEGVVGLLIVALGLRVLWRLHRDRVHIHVHAHGGRRHIHAHSHAGETRPHAEAPHGHRHRLLSLRGMAGTMAIGLVHGAAGSAGLLVLTVSATQSLGQALLYFGVFGLGTMTGMTLLTVAASYPLALVERGASWMRTGLTVAIAGFALWIGGTMAAGHLPALFAPGL